MFGSIVKVPSPGPPIFFPIDACSLGSSPHCTEVCCSLPHAFTFENVCCQAKEMTSPQYKILAKFTTAVCVHRCSFSRRITVCAEWHSVLRMAVKMAAIVRFPCSTHAYIPPVKSEVGLLAITPQLTIKMAAQAKSMTEGDIRKKKFVKPYAKNAVA